MTRGRWCGLTTGRWLKETSREGAGAAHNAVVAARDRGPEFFVEVEVQDPILKSQRLLKERLKNHFSMMRAVSFANQGG